MKNLIIFFGGNGTSASNTSSTLYNISMIYDAEVVMPIYPGYWTDDKKDSVRQCLIERALRDFADGVALRHKKLGNDGNVNLMVVGLSLGSAVALRFARMSKNVYGVVLCDPFTNIYDVVVSQSVFLHAKLPLMLDNWLFRNIFNAVVEDEWENMDVATCIDARITIVRSGCDMLIHQHVITKLWKKIRTVQNGVIVYTEPLAGHGNCVARTHFIRAVEEEFKLPHNKEVVRAMSMQGDVA